MPSDVLAIDGGAPVRTAPWPSWPVWDEAEERALLGVLHSGKWWRVGGVETPAVEEAFARLHGVEHALGVTSGTAALEVTLRALGIGCGDEVIVPAYTFIATASAVLSSGAAPVFADVEPDSLCIDPASAEAAVTPRTRAVIAVHVAGRPANMDGVLALAGRQGLAVIEDAAQAHGAAWRGRPVGSLGDVGTFSFQASKNLTAGEGGMVTCRDAAMFERLWPAVNAGRARGGGWHDSVVGGNFRLAEWQAAILRCQMARLPEQMRLREEAAARLTERLAAIPGMAPLPPDPAVTRHAHHLFLFRYDPAAFGGRPRAWFLEALAAEGVPCDDGYEPLYRLPIFRSARRCASAPLPDYAAVRCPVTERACSELVWLTQPLLLAGAPGADDIADAIAKVRRGSRQ